MSLKIRCYTLFDITKTGVTNRRNSNNPDPKWQKQRNTQCNFDTILQVASLRSQPENITDPVESLVTFSEFDKFGFLFEALYADCDGVPMIQIGTEWGKLPTFLDSSTELRNIYFEVIPDENE